MPTISLRPPAGYRNLVPLNRTEHAGLGLAPQSHSWAAELNALPLGVAEFSSAAANYPIVFVRDSDSGEFIPMVAMGLRSGENLFVDAKGHWLPRCYLPAAARRYPFCITEIANPEGGPPQRLVCFEKGTLSPDGTPLFTAKGEATPAWDATQRLLEAIEASRLQTRVLCKRLDALGLFTPFDALAMPRNGQRMRLQGLFRIDEEKMNGIPGKDLRVMLRKGELKATYAHLISLENFATLMELAIARDTAAATN